jgi:molybdenum cofactor cytidylyltransferase
MIAAVLLAAGGSRRMGRPKLELDLAGRTVLQRSVDALLASPADLLLVVTPPGGLAALADYHDPRLRAVANPNPAAGMASSIRVALGTLSPDTRAVLLALADKPLVRPRTVTLVVEKFEESRALLVYPTYRGQQGHPVLVASALFGELTALEGDVGAKSLLSRHASRALALETDDPGVLLDIDNPDDYAKALKLLQGSGSL